MADPVGHIDLDREQEQLLLDLVDAARQVPRHEQEFHLISFDQGEMLRGPGGQRPVLARDVYVLDEVGLLEHTQLNYVYGNKYVVSATGYR